MTPRGRFRRPFAAVALTVALVATAVAPATGTSGAGPADPTARCADLVGEQVRVQGDVAVVRTAEVVAASGATPEHCDVGGSIGRITFQMRLPTTEWNGRYFQTGCGGFCGFVPIGSCAPALERGYAVAAEDTGHRGSAGDGSWALGDRQAEVDWGHRSPHVTAVAAKALVETYYGTPPAYSYFQGCSTGGRQALQEVQRYPRDFDGVVAGAPALYQNQLATLSQGYLETVNRDDEGRVILTSAKARVLHQAVLAACDAPDGRVDGVVGDPDACGFEPASIQCPDGPDGQDGADCLTAEQVRVAEAFYAPPVDDRGRVVYPAGMPLGSEGGWPGYSIGTDASLSGGGNYAQEVLRYLAFPRDPGAEYSLFDFDPTRDAPRLEPKAAVYNADDTNLRPFDRQGGKLVVWHGWADPLITAGGTVDWFADAVQHSGGQQAADDFMRLFLLPGVFHCSGGPGEGTVDWLTVIERWVEDGVAPDAVTATRQAPDGSVAGSRVVPAYRP